MKKTLHFIFVITFSLSVTSCIRSIIPLRDKYQEVPVKSKYSASYDKVWESIIDFISDTGQEVQLVDKESGLIISDLNLTPGLLISHEDKKGKILNPNAYMASTRFNDDLPRPKLINHYGFSKWTIRVKELMDSEITVAVLVHVKDIEQGIGTGKAHFKGASTGNYEKIILDQISERIEAH